MYKFYKDKERIFKCQLAVQGAEYNQCKARLIFQDKNYSAMYEGYVEDTGFCQVKVPKSPFKEGLQGIVKLEIIVDTTLFKAWSDNFEVVYGKKIEIKFMDDKVDESKVNNDNIKISATMIY